MDEQFSPMQQESPAEESQEHNGHSVTITKTDEGFIVSGMGADPIQLASLDEALDSVKTKFAPETDSPESLNKLFNQSADAGMEQGKSY
tara:strand:+ start:649 stop:915 length:267 start_codon:yes stop_codon:yes gene_type:complete